MAADISWNVEEQQRTKDNLFAIDYPHRELIRDVLDPLIYKLMETVKGTHLGGIGIIRLPPHLKIEPHYDLGKSVQFYDRYHITVDGPEGCEFICGHGDDEERVEMRDGEVWWFDSKKIHSVENNSVFNRVSISCDISSQ